MYHFRDIIGIIESYYFPNEDIGLNSGEQGFITHNNTPICWDTSRAYPISSFKLSEKIQFKVEDVVPFYSRNDFCIHICVKILKNQHNYALITSNPLKSHINKDKPVFVLYKYTSLFNIKARKCFDFDRLPILDINIQGFYGNLISTYGSVNDLLTQGYNTCNYKTNASLLNSKFTLIKPKYIFNDEWETYQNQPIYCYFEDTKQYGYLYLDQTSLMFTIAKQRMKYYGITMMHFNIGLDKHFTLKAYTNLYCSDVNDAASVIVDYALKVVLLSDNVYYNCEINDDSGFVAVKCVQIGSKINDKCFWIKQEVIREQTHLGHDLNDIKFHRYIDEWNMNPNGIQVDDREYIFESRGTITSYNGCVGYNRLNTLGRVGFFEVNNRFKLMDPKIYKLFNKQYIRVQIIIKDIHHERIDLRLSNKTVYIELVFTNLWRITSQYLEYIKDIQKFKESNKDISLYKKGKILFKYSLLGVSYNKYYLGDYNCGYIKKNDEIYLISPKHNDVQYGDTICIYSKKYDYIGWLRNNCTTFGIDKIDQTKIIKELTLLNSIPALKQTYASIYPVKFVLQNDFNSVGNIYVKILDYQILNRSKYVKVICVSLYSILYGLTFWLQMR